MHLTPNSPPLASFKSLKKILKIDDIQELINTKDAYYNSFNCSNSGRQLYSVKEPLKTIQRKIRAYFFIPLQYPSFLFGGVPKKDYLSNCEVHKGQEIVLSEDIKSFYPSIKQERVREIFQYFFHSPPEIADILAEICCFKGEVIMGSVLSTDIANLVFFDREPHLVKELYEKNLIYTRYVDDVTVSSKKALSKKEITSVKEKVYGMLRANDFAINRRKSKIMAQDGRMTVHGVLVNNQKLGTTSEKKANLRAALHSLRVAVEQKKLSIDEFVGKYRSIRGRIQTLERAGYKGDKARTELTNIMRLIDEVEIKRFIRILRRVKSKQSYQRVLGRISVFKGYSSNIARIIKFEKRDARNRIFK